MARPCHAHRHRTRRAPPAAGRPSAPARGDHPLHARRAGLDDLAGWPWVDYDGAAPADGDAGGRASLFGLLHDLHERTGRRAGTVIRAGPAGPFPIASGPYLAWLPLKFLHAFDPDLRPLPVSEPRTPPLPDRRHRPALGRGPGGVPVAPTGGARRGAGEKRKTAAVDLTRKIVRPRVRSLPLVTSRVGNSGSLYRPGHRMGLKHDANPRVSFAAASLSTRTRRHRNWDHSNDKRTLVIRSLDDGRSSQAARRRSLTH